MADETMLSLDHAPTSVVSGVADDGMTAALRDAVLTKLRYVVGSDPAIATDHDWYVAACLAVRDRIVDPWLASTSAWHQVVQKRVYYLSLEFLIGRLLRDSLSNLGLFDQMEAALGGLGVDLGKVLEIEPDAALGNGGLGRLAACFMESMATLSLPARGYGIRYNAGLFRQTVQDGWQLEHPEDWLSRGNPWEFIRPNVSFQIGFGGRIESAAAHAGVAAKHVWHPSEVVDAIAYDTPVIGWRGRHATTLRLWSARAADPIRLDSFNRGDHVGAIEARARANAISQVLYPGDDTPAGQELRLRQEYFFSSASLQDLIAQHLSDFGDIRSLGRGAAVQLNDTHPALAVVELMRLLVDVHDIPWEEAWTITCATLSYTNHTLLPEALETWPVSLLERLLPRHLQIIYHINWLHLERLSREGVPGSVLSGVSLVDENGSRRVRMGNLAFLGSHKVNGVSALHTELMKRTVFRELHTLYPDRIENKTNGITFRRWLFSANPALTKLLVELAGPGVLDYPEELGKFADFADNSGVHDRLGRIRHANKVALSALIRQRLGLKVDPAALFDVQIKRIHEYKRQLLNILETVALYDAIRQEPHRAWVPRVKIFAGKAAPGYHRAKLIIKLINDIAQVVNADPDVRGLIKVVYLPNYNVSLAERLIPAADLSEQISTAGMEASGTGNMKLALNGALTIGTLDGANIEIREHVGEENFFEFGLTAAEVEECRRSRAWPNGVRVPENLERVLALLDSGFFSNGDGERFRGMTAELRQHDTFMVAADFDSFSVAQRAVDARWQDRPAWWRSSILNTANSGWCSSDRTIKEYAATIWNARPIRASY